MLVVAFLRPIAFELPVLAALPAAGEDAVRADWKGHVVEA